MCRLDKFISITYRHNSIYYSREMAKTGVTNGQYMFILCVFENEGISQDELAEKLNMDKSTVARGVAQLVNEKFLLKKSNEKDKRIFNIFTTKKGKDVYPELVKILNERNKFLMKDFSDEEKKLAVEILKKISENVLEHSKREE